MKTPKNLWVEDRTKIITNMLDNPNSVGIYPTTECYRALDGVASEFVNKEITNVLDRIEAWIEINGENIQPLFGYTTNQVNSNDLIEFIYKLYPIDEITK